MDNLTREIRVVGRDFKTAGKVEIYRFPGDWSVREYALAARAPLGQEAMKAAVSQPFSYRGGTSSLRALASGNENVIILVDDLTRPTPAKEILPHVLSILAEAGVSRDRISIVFALGTHRPLTEDEMALKIGGDAVRRYRTENHDCIAGEFVHVGRGSYGTEIRISRKVIEADLIVTLNTITKHRFFYACGGAKMILPGVAHQDTILHNHRDMLSTDVLREEGHRYGQARQEMHEAARAVMERTELVCIDVTVDPLGGVTGMYVGDPVDVFETNIDDALETYEVDFDRADYGASGKADIGFFRMGFHSCDAIQMARSLDNWEQVCAVPAIISDCGDVIYYDGKRHGPYKDYIGGLKGKETYPNPPLEECLKGEGYTSSIVYSPNLDIKSTHLSLPGMYVTSDWDGLLQDLYRHLGPDQQVAFFHDASIHILNVR